MKRLVSLVTIAATLLMLVALLATPLAVMAQDGHGDDETGTETETGESGAAEEAERAARRGAAVYAEFCQACHGPQGEGSGTGPAFPALAFDPESAPGVIAEGQDSDPEDGVAMPGYGDVLSEEQIEDLVTYMATWGTGEALPLPEPNVTVEVEDVPDYFGDPHAGAEVYAKFCAACHGPDGAGRDGDAFPELEFEPNDTRRIAAEGAESEYMPAFSAGSGGPLSEQQLTDLETYLASWNVEEETDDDGGETGIAVMIVLLGVVAILTIGAAYITRPPAEAGADEA